MKIVVIGYSKMFASIIEAVLESKHELVGVFRHDRVKYNSLHLFFKDILNPTNDISFIKSKGLYEIKARSVNSKKFINEMEKLKPDIIFVCSWGEKIKKEAFSIPKIGMINIHPSLLPKYRGPNPYARVLFNDEKYTGVTFHFVTDKVDAGPILEQKSFKILDSDDGLSLRNKAAALATVMCKGFLDKNEDNLINLQYQDESKATYYGALTLKDAILDFNQPSNLIIKRIKGLYPWAQAFLDCNGKFLKVKKYELYENLENIPPRTVVYKKGREIAITTVDNKIIKFIDTKLIKTLLSPSTRLFIKFGLGDKI